MGCSVNICEECDEINWSTDAICSKCGATLGPSFDEICITMGVPLVDQQKARLHKLLKNREALGAYHCREE